MRLSIVIPAYNEEQFIEDTLKKVFAIDYGIPFEVIVVNDGSTDGTQQVLEKIMAKHTFKLIRKPNGGKTSAINAGYAASKNSVICVQDADGEYDPQDIPALLSPIVERKTKVVFGNRFVYGGKGALKNRIGNWGLSLIASILFFKRVYDVEVGYKLFTREVAKEVFPLESKGFGLEPEIFAKVCRADFNITQVPISYVPRSVEEGKKIGVIDGVKALGTLLKYRFRYSRKKNFKYTTTIAGGMRCGSD